MPISIFLGFMLLGWSGLWRNFIQWTGDRLQRQWLRDMLAGFALALCYWVFTLPVLYYLQHIWGQTSGAKIVIKGLPKESPETPSYLSQIGFDWLTRYFWTALPWIILVALLSPLCIKIVRRWPKTIWILPAIILSIWAVNDSSRSSSNTAYESLPDTQFSDKLKQTAIANGVDPNIMVIESQIDLLYSARVTGLGPWRRIVFGRVFFNEGPLTYNVKIAGIKPPPVTEEGLVFVAAHEIAHAKSHHLLILHISQIMLITFLLWGFWKLTGRLSLKHEKADRHRGEIIMALPSYISALAVAFIIYAMVINVVTLMNERSADRQALDITREPFAAARYSLFFTPPDTAYGRPLEQWLLLTHPSQKERIITAMQWAKENLPDAKMPETPVWPDPPPKQ